MQHRPTSYEQDRAAAKRGGLVAALAILIALFAASCVATAPAATRPQDAAPAPDTNATGDAGASSPASSISLLPAEEPPFSTANWSTDFTRRTVEWSSILSGGPPKDGIPAVDNPSFEDVDAAATWLSDRDPVILFAHNDATRAYPLAVLIWHEIVNDEVGGKPVAITFCPLCNASIVFDREFGGQVLDFGTTGKLRNSDLIMYDRQTETWWQQFTGEAIVGEFTGSQLDFLASQVISFGDFREEFPESQVLARPPVSRSYGSNPYVGYDSSTNPFLFDGTLDERLRATARVVGVTDNGVAMAYPFDAVAQAGAINDVVNETPIVVFHKAGTASALDTGAIADGRDIGSVAVFARRVDDQLLTFTANGDGTFRDDETGSTWTILGEAVDGDLSGRQLERVLSFDHFWFAWSAFFPETGLFGAE